MARDTTESVYSQLAVVATADDTTVTITPTTPYSLDGHSTLNGSNDPLTAGIYTYIPISNITLLPNSSYTILLTSGTAFANGAYEWSDTGINSYNAIGGWIGENASYFLQNNGSQVFGNLINSQYAIEATSVPEPSAGWLLLLGSGVFHFTRKCKNILYDEWLREGVLAVPEPSAEVTIQIIK